MVGGIEVGIAVGQEFLFALAGHTTLLFLHERFGIHSVVLGALQRLTLSPLCLFKMS
jgi:hypothetical protein